MENFKKYWRVWLIVVIVIFLYLCINDGSSYVAPIEGADYISGCEKMVLDRIKSPSTAIFSDVVYVEGNSSIDAKLQYGILWKLDSENSFWAMMRWTFWCQKNWWEDMTVTIAE